MQLWEYRCLDCDTLVCRDEDEGDDELHEWLWCDSCCGLCERDEPPTIKPDATQMEIFV